MSNEKKQYRKGISDLVSGIGDALLGSNIQIKINDHELVKDEDNNISYVLTKEKVRTSIQFNNNKKIKFTIQPVSSFETEEAKVDK
jgi:hypothetical protein